MQLKPNPNPVVHVLQLILISTQLYNLSMNKYGMECFLYM